MVKCLEDRELKERSRTHWLRTASFMAGHDVFRLKIIIEINFVICIMKARTYDIICFLSFSVQLSSEHKEHSHSCFYILVFAVWLQGPKYCFSERSALPVCETRHQSHNDKHAPISLRCMIILMHVCMYARTYIRIWMHAILFFRTLHTNGMQKARREPCKLVCKSSPSRSEQALMRLSAGNLHFWRKVMAK